MFKVKYECELFTSLDKRFLTVKNNKKQDFLFNFFKSDIQGFTEEITSAFTCLIL